MLFCLIVYNYLIINILIGDSLNRMFQRENIRIKIEILGF